MAEETVQRNHSRLRIRADQWHWSPSIRVPTFVKAIVGGVTTAAASLTGRFKPIANRDLLSSRLSTTPPFASGRYGPDSSVEDTPVSYPDGYKLYTPKNYDGSFMGAISIRRALESSRNVPAVKLGQAVGIDAVIEVARMLGIESPMDPVISLPLGAVDLTPLEMAGAYATFASNGWHSEPTLIVQVRDSVGNVLLDNISQAPAHFRSLGDSLINQRFTRGNQ